MYRVLLVVDLQQDFCEGGALAVPKTQSLIPGINAILTQYDFVLATQDYHPANHISFASQHPGKTTFQRIMLDYGPQVLWPDHCVQHTQGANLHPGLNDAHIHGIVRKGYHAHIDSYSAFFENDHTTPTLLSALIKPAQCAVLHICGLAREYCVEYTYQDALRLGFNTDVLENLCRGFA
ncbi:MAG: bifunctional nicotinamidase/pyrazinamidase [Spirochaetia bacterium]